MPTVPTEMTFGVSRDQGLFEWSGTSLSSIFAQKANILKPRMWHMIFDILRFNQFALDLLSEKDESEEDPTGAGGAVSDADGPQHQESVGKYLDRERYSKGFRDDYLIPMTACVWSTRPDKCSLEFPVVTLVRFLWNHHLLSSISARPEWMTIPGGSQKYIGAVLSDFPSQFIHLKTKIDKLVVKENNQIDLHTKDGATSTFDHVVLASHGNQALDIVREAATDEEREVLSGFKTSTNTAVLHSDTSVSVYSPYTSGIANPRNLANAHPFSYLGVVELHNAVNINFRQRLIHLLDLLDESPPAHSTGNIWSRPRDPQPSTRTQSTSHTRRLGVSPPLVQCCSNPLPENATPNSKFTKHQLRGSLDEIRVPRRRFLERDKSCHGSFGS